MEPDNTHVTSQVIPITKSAKKLEVENSRSVSIIRKPRGLSNCGEKYCIKKGDKNELIREINIRLNKRFIIKEFGDLFNNDDLEK